VQSKSDSNAEKPAEDQGMRIVFTFLGVFGGVLILVSIFIVSYCIHRRRNVNKQINNGMHNYNIIIFTTLSIEKDFEKVYALMNDRSGRKLLGRYLLLM